MENNKKIALVTGATGFVGSHLVDLLLNENYAVRVLTRKGSNLKWIENKNIKIFDCGFFDFEELKKSVTNVDLVFHIAGVVKAKNWDDYYKGNVETTKNLLDAILEVNPKIEKIVVVSSFAANGPAKEGTFATEDSIPNPITRYGKSKLEQEKITGKYFDKLPITIIRPPAVYGERDTEIFLVFKTYKAGLMTMVGFNKKLVSIVHVLDLVRGIYLAGISEKSNGEIFCIGSDKFYTWDEIAEATHKAFGKNALKIKIPHFLVYTIGAIAEFLSIFSSKPATFNFEKARDFVQQYQTCSIEKAKTVLGYQPEINLEEGIKRTVDWYKSNNWL